MNVIARPRIRVPASAGDRASRSSPAKTIPPLSIAALAGRTPRIARASVVFPQPDSPTRPMISPRRSDRLTLSSTRATPLSAWNESDSAVTSSSGGAASPGTVGAPSDARVEHVAQSVAQQVEPHDDEQDRDARRGRVPPRLRQEFAAFRDHAAPFRRRRRGAETEKAERGRDQDGAAHSDGGAHDDRAH